MGSKFNGKRLTYQNIKDYLNEQYPNATKIERIARKDISIYPRKQEDFGEEQDCTLCTIATILNYYSKKTPFQQIYELVESLAKKYFYNGKIWGTPVLAQQKIYQKSFDCLGIPQDTHRLICCHNHNKLINILYTGHPMLLSIWHDNRNFYNRHTVTIIGYEQYKIDDCIKTFYTCYDN